MLDLRGDYHRSVNGPLLKHNPSQTEASISKVEESKISYITFSQLKHNEGLDILPCEQ